MKRRFNILTLMMAVAVMFGVVPASHAGTLTVTIDVNVSGGTDVSNTLTGSLAQCPAGDTTDTLCVNLAGYNQNGITFNAASGAGTDTPGEATGSYSDESNFNVSSTNLSNTTITITETADGFNLPTPAWVSASLTTEAVTGKGFLGATETADVSGNSLGSCSTSGTGAQSCNLSPVYYPNTPFTLNQTTTLNLAANGSVSSQEDVNAAVPEPGSMMLLGTGLTGFAAMLRRRKKTVL